MQENIARCQNVVHSFYTGPGIIVFKITLIWVQVLAQYHLCYSYLTRKIIDDMIVPNKNFKLGNVFKRHNLPIRKDCVLLLMLLCLI